MADDAALAAAKGSLFGGGTAAKKLAKANDAELDAAKGSKGGEEGAAKRRTLFGGAKKKAPKSSDAELDAAKGALFGGGAKSPAAAAAPAPPPPSPPAPPAPAPAPPPPAAGSGGGLPARAELLAMAAECGLDEELLDGMLEAYEGQPDAHAQVAEMLVMQVRGTARIAHRACSPPVSHVARPAHVFHHYHPACPQGASPPAAAPSQAPSPAPVEAPAAAPAAGFIMIAAASDSDPDDDVDLDNEPAPAAPAPAALGRGELLLMAEAVGLVGFHASSSD